MYGFVRITQTLSKCSAKNYPAPKDFANNTFPIHTPVPQYFAKDFAKELKMSSAVHTGRMMSRVLWTRLRNE